MSSEKVANSLNKLPLGQRGDSLASTKESNACQSRLGARCGPFPELRLFEQNLRESVNNYFAKENLGMFKYLLDHQYNEDSLRWNLLKGKDQTYAKVLLAIAKSKGYVPYLALVRHYDWWNEDCEEEEFIDGKPEFYFWIDENNQQYEIGKLIISGIGMPFLDKIKMFKPCCVIESKSTGNEGIIFKQWYYGSCLVLWKNSWSYFEGYKAELAALHKLTNQPGRQKTLMKKIKDNEKDFLNTNHWRYDTDGIKKMILDIVIFLSDAEMTGKILKEFKPSDILNFGKTEVVKWILNTWNIELWRNLIDAWKPRVSGSLSTLLTFLSCYLTEEFKNVEVAEYLLNETADLFIKTKNDFSIQDGGNCSNKLTDHDLCSLLLYCYRFGKFELEENLLENMESVPPAEEAARFGIYERRLNLDQLTRISGKLLYNTNACLMKIEKENYVYAEPNMADLETISSLLENAVVNKSVEAHILNHIMSDRATYTALFLAELFVRMKEVLGDHVNNYEQFKTHVLFLINERIRELSKPDDWSIPIEGPCSCELCWLVQAFFVSSTSTKLSLVEAKNSEEHINSFLNAYTYMPIKFKAVNFRAGNCMIFNLTVIK